MTAPSTKILLSYQEILEQTRLGKLCGTKNLFRDRYQIRQVLGRGGFGVTFLGRNVTIPGSPPCVIKQLCLPSGSRSDALDRARTRFRKEAKILSLLGHHSQIPLLLDYFVIDEEFYLVQEFIKGYTLSKIVKRYGVQPEEFVKRILKSILPVLNYIHARGVIHRDIKPQNVILAADDGRLVLIDFGSVKEELHLADDTMVQFLTQHFIGTLGFSPPEQFSLRPVYASDIYSLGMTCLFLLTGAKPLELQDEIQKNKIKWKDKVDISKGFARIINKMIHPDLEKRYNNSSQVLQDLDILAGIKPNGEIIDLSEDNFSQWMAIQSKKEISPSQDVSNSNVSQTPHTKPPSSMPRVHKSIDKSEYSAELFTSYSVYSRLSQAKNRLYENGKNPLTPTTSAIAQETQGNVTIQQETTQIQRKKISFIQKILNKIKKIFRFV
jgi:serine/threonine protein kinase